MPQAYTAFDDIDRDDLNIPLFKAPKVGKAYQGFMGLAMPFVARIPERSFGPATTAMNLLSVALQGLAHAKLKKSAQHYKKYEMNMARAMQQYQADMNSYKIIMAQNSENRKYMEMQLRDAAAQRRDNIMLRALDSRNANAYYDRVTEMEKMSQGLQMHREKLRNAYMLTALRMSKQLKPVTTNDILHLDRINNERQQTGQPLMPFEEFMQMKSILSQKPTELPADVRTAQIASQYPEIGEKIKELKFKPETEQPEKIPTAIDEFKSFQAMSPKEQEAYIKFKQETRSPNMMEMLFGERGTPTETPTTTLDITAPGKDPKVVERIKSYVGKFPRKDVEDSLKAFGINPSLYEEELKLLK